MNTVDTSKIRSGLKERLPYSLSRETDIPAFYMDWFLEKISVGYVYAAGPKDMVPSYWSLKPEDVYSLVFWSRDYGPLLKVIDKLSDYNLVFNMTINGPEKFSKKTPSYKKALDQMNQLVNLFGPEVVSWRFSPISDPFNKRVFTDIAESVALMGINECFASFIHSNPFVKEERSDSEKRDVLFELSEIANKFDMNVKVSWDDLVFTDLENVGPAKCISGDRI